MCGIVGYIGPNQAAPFLLDGMGKLEYRGYDSSGIAVFNGDKLVIEKCVGKLENLRNKLAPNMPKGTIGIGHTRWATHGRPSDSNSHPHFEASGRFAVVHNGIIENYLVLKESLILKGYTFTSETDTEVVAHLLADLDTGDFVQTAKKVLNIIEGSYALVLMCTTEPDKLICTKKNNPLIIGLGEGENFIASDIPAVISKTRRNYILSDGEFAVVTKDKIWVEDAAGVPISKQVFEVNWDAEAATKGGYEHFMLKEIFEQPQAVRATMSTRIDKDSSIAFKELNWNKNDLAGVNKVFIVACGTAYHAGMVGKYYIEQLARIPVEVDIASEFRYRKPIIDENTLMIIISQSGETSDTLEALKEAKRLGARTLAVTNVVASSIAREAEQVVYTYAGPEIAVASTKAYTTQLVVMLMLAIYMAQIKGLTPELLQEIVQSLQLLPKQLEEYLRDVKDVEAFAIENKNARDMFFLGRSLDYAVAMEGSLKLKEISYIHAEAYAAGELKHGPLALITEEVTVFGIATQLDVYEKTISNIKEVKARDAKVIGIAMQGDTTMAKEVDHVIYIPRANKYVMPVLTVIPLQLFSYYAAVVRGCDVDKPRNLAKSVTVE